MCVCVDANWLAKIYLFMLGFLNLFLSGSCSRPRQKYFCQMGTFTCSFIKKNSGVIQIEKKQIKSVKDEGYLRVSLFLY